MKTTVPVMNKEKHKTEKEYRWMVRAVMKKLVIFHYDEGSRAGAVYQILCISDVILIISGYE